MDKEKEIITLNEKIKSPISSIDSSKGFEIISESMVSQIRDVFGRNTLLSILYQIGKAPANEISKRLKKKYGKEEFTISEAFEALLKELNDYYSIQIKDMKSDGEKIRVIIENHCFLRNPIKNRKQLKFGKALCRVPKGYFETAFKNLIGDKIKKVEINYLENDDEKDVCIEEILFWL